MHHPSRTLRHSLAAVTVAVALTACAGLQPAPEKSLYERLGGMPAITAVIDDFVANVAADPRINGFFAGTDIPRLKRLLVAQVCEAGGGPCRYDGRPMKAAHAGMGISEGHFNALVEDLVKSLDRFKVPAREQNELLGILGPMKGEIVGG